ncbi:hypothetical protein Pint_15936 [Pistacia integerrima]|uniref:Uncharacterized protein n=1 Tax=Pistacia integerrima TaxID=434235 RepID=A0ACC0ZC56_9ROSI|nr:hypothetical protein Pint_15936 [Pistacia integerrima]
MDLLVEIMIQNYQFDILRWWKTYQNIYPILSVIAHDLLTSLVSIVVSESAFSVGGRVLDKRRSSLHLSAVETLMCMKD